MRKEQNIEARKRVPVSGLRSGARPLRCHIPMSEVRRLAAGPNPEGEQGKDGGSA